MSTLVYYASVIKPQGAVRGSQGDVMAPPSPSGGRTAVPSFRQTNDVTPLSDTHAVR